MALCGMNMPQDEQPTSQVQAVETFKRLKTDQLITAEPVLRHVDWVDRVLRSREDASEPLRGVFLVHCLAGWDKVRLCLFLTLCGPVGKCWQKGSDSCSTPFQYLHPSSHIHPPTHTPSLLTPPRASVCWAPHAAF